MSMPAYFVYLNGFEALWASLPNGSGFRYVGEYIWEFEDYHEADAWRQTNSYFTLSNYDPRMR